MHPSLTTCALSPGLFQRRPKAREIVKRLGQHLAKLHAAPLALAIWAASLLLGLSPGSGFLPLVSRLVVMGGVIGGSLWLFCLNAEDRAMVLGLALRRGPRRSGSR